VPLLTGGIFQAPGAEADAGAVTNGAVLVAPGVPAQRYDKTRLVPFAERVPGVGLLPALDAFAVPAGGVRAYRRGDGPRVLTVRDTTARDTTADDAREATHVGPMICFESVFGGLGRAYARRGADVLVVLAQSGWWAGGRGARQHLALTRLRAVETGRAVVVATVSGVSALVLPDGRVTASLGWQQRGVLRVRVPLPPRDRVPPRDDDDAPRTTPFVRLGSFLGPLAAALTLAFTVRRLLRPACRPSTRRFSA
jgi:apolipoprotein N-acyltransferase